MLLDSIVLRRSQINDTSEVIFLFTHDSFHHSLLSVVAPHFPPRKPHCTHSESKFVPNQNRSLFSSDKANSSSRQGLSGRLNTFGLE